MLCPDFLGIVQKTVWVFGIGLFGQCETSEKKKDFLSTKRERGREGQNRNYATCTSKGSTHRLCNVMFFGTKLD